MPVFMLVMIFVVVFYASESTPTSPPVRPVKLEVSLWKLQYEAATLKCITKVTQPNSKEWSSLNRLMKQLPRGSRDEAGLLMLDGLILRCTDTEVGE